MILSELQFTFGEVKPDYVTPLFALIGVLIGLAVPPLLTNFLDKKKRKKEIKKELLNTLYLIYSITKEHCRVTCNYNFLIRRDTIYRYEKTRLTNPEAIKGFEWVIASDKELLNHNLQKAESLFLSLSEYEAKLIGLSHEIESYYKSKTHKKIDQIVKDVLRESNKENRYPTDLKSNTSIELEDEQKIYGERSTKFISSIQSQCEEVIDQVSKIL